MFFSLLHTTYSCLHAVPRPEQVAGRLKELGYPGAALTDLGNLGGAPSFLKALKGAGLKPVVGTEFFIEGPLPKTFSRILVLARNQAGWLSLVKAVSLSNDPASYTDRPRLPLAALKEFSKDWFVVTGYPNTALADAIFKNPAHYLLAQSPEDARASLREDAPSSFTSCLDHHLSLFGDSLVLGTHLLDCENFPCSQVLAGYVRRAAQEKGLPVIALSDSYYLRKEDASDQRVLLCTHLKTTFKDVDRALSRDFEGAVLRRFFRSNRYHVPTLDELRAHHPESELACSLELASKCEPPTIGGGKYLPTFSCPNGLSPDDFLKEQCRIGWRKKIDPFLKALPAKLAQDKRKEYGDRAKMELEVLCGAGLSSYFLIVQDYIRHAREVLKKKVGPGRGSSSGSLCAFLLDITRVDPIQYDLLFERFYNVARASSLPDCDVDFEPDARESLIAYLREKYGEANVYPIGTFSRLQGRSVLKDVLKVHGRGSYEELNRITAPVPDEAAISDDLQAMREEEEEAGIILWALENRGPALRDWVHKTPGGELDGPLSSDFAQAIRLEGGVRGMGKHASGYIICPVPVSDVVPLAYDKGENGLMTGFGMKDVEGAGLLKVDILGLKTLSALATYEHILRTGSL